MRSPNDNHPNQQSPTRILLRCFGYLRPHWKLTVGAYLMMFLIDAISMINPQLIRWTIDNGISVDSTYILTLTVVALLALVTIKGFFTYFEGLWTEIASQNVAYDL